MGAHAVRPLRPSQNQQGWLSTDPDPAEGPLLGVTPKVSSDALPASVLPAVGRAGAAGALGAAGEERRAGEWWHRGMGWGGCTAGAHRCLLRPAGRAGAVGGAGGPREGGAHGTQGRVTVGPWGRVGTLGTHWDLGDGPGAAPRGPPLPAPSSPQGDRGFDGQQGAKGDQGEKGDRVSGWGGDASIVPSSAFTSTKPDDPKRATQGSALSLSWVTNHFLKCSWRT